MRTKKRSLAVLVGLLGVVLLAGACHKKVAAPRAATATTTATATSSHRDVNRRTQYD